MTEHNRPDLFLYHHLASSASRKVRFCLAEKGLAYGERQIDFVALEQIEDWYLEIHPEGVVPALMIDGRVFIDSNLINEYLDARYSKPPLRPDSAEERYELQHWSRYIDTMIRPAQVKFNIMQAVVPFASKWSDEELARVVDTVPTEERKDAWWRAARKPYSDVELADAMALILEMADDIERRLESGDWLFGGRFGLGEINTTPYIKRLSELQPGAVTAAARPRLADWWQRITRRPAYAQARIGIFDA